MMSMKMGLLWTLLLFMLAFISKGNAAGECPKPVVEGKLLLSDSAILKNNFPDGSEVTLECAIGFVVDKGHDTIKCTNGVWSTQELICKEKDCGHPTPVPNVLYEIPNGTLFGAYIRSLCERGYALQGSTYRQCLANGWTGRVNCSLVRCGKPIKIPHSTIVSKLTKEILEFGDVIEYRCDDNYTLVGNGSVVCQENKNYSSLPQCKVVTCGKPIQIPHSIIVSKLTKEFLEFGDDIEYNCKETYALVGNGSVVCQQNGEYSSLPQCRERSDAEKDWSFIVVAVIAATAVILVPVLILLYLKNRKGSYDTGEEKKPKDALIQEKPFYYVHNQCKEL